MYWIMKMNMLVHTILIDLVPDLNERWMWQALCFCIMNISRCTEFFLEVSLQC
jgi:hypothetical protein